MENVKLIQLTLQLMKDHMMLQLQDHIILHIQLKMIALVLQNMFLHVQFRILILHLVCLGIMKIDV